MRVLLGSFMLACTAIASSADAQSFDPADAVSISYADLNLAHPAGRAALEGRVKAASNRLCHDLTISPVEEVVAVANCRASMMTSAKRQLGLTALRSPGGTMRASR